MKGTHLATHCVARGLAPTAKNHLGPHWPLKCHLIAKHENYVAMHVLVAMQQWVAHPGAHNAMGPRLLASTHHHVPCH